MQNLRISLVQNDTVWHDAASNREILEKLITNSNANLIVFPEMFSTGFTMNSIDVAEHMNGETVNWMRHMAEASKAAICGSLVIKEEGNHYNRFIWAAPDGILITYDKRHLFRMADEDNYYQAGQGKVVIDYLGWKISPQICYDLRFPVWARNSLQNENYDYDLLINVANWPEARINAWDSLLMARAIENHAYAIGVNRVGTDDKGIKYCGHSGAYSPKGETLCFLEDKLVVDTIDLDYDELYRYRKQFPAQLDADKFEIKF